MLQIDYARKRQARLLDVLQERNLDAVVLGLRHHAYYLSTHLPFWQHQVPPCGPAHPIGSIDSYARFAHYPGSTHASSVLDASGVVVNGVKKSA